jgi:hypothetical protein
MWSLGIKFNLIHYFVKYVVMELWLNPGNIEELPLIVNRSNKNITKNQNQNYQSSVKFRKKI